MCKCNCCNCEFKGELVERISRDRMIQFVNDLNDKYEVVKNQILLNNPMPSVSRAYSLILHIEQQNEVTSLNEMSAMNLDIKKTDSTKRYLERKKRQQENKNMFCDVRKKKNMVGTHVFKCMVCLIGIKT